VTAGTTVLGAFDPIEPIAALCASEGLWLHVDGSWGGSVALSETQRHLLRGSESADSFTWNPHKMMGLPLPCSAILLRQSGTLAQVHGGGGSEYLFHDDSSVPDLGPISLQCGRRVDALKLWLAWRCLGTTGFAQRIDHLFALCQKAKERVDREPLLELVREPVSVNIVFRYRPEGVDSDEELDRINILLRETLYRRGLALVNYATVDSTEVFRLVFANADLSTTDVNRLFDDLLACGTELFGKQGG